MSKIKLKPCPFCGGENTALCSNDAEQLYNVECRDCGCGPCDHFAPEIAADVWNRRV